jgi:hypothetical protein
LGLDYSIFKKTPLKPVVVISKTQRIYGFHEGNELTTMVTRELEPNGKVFLLTNHPSLNGALFTLATTID